MAVAVAERTRDTSCRHQWYKRRQT